MHVHYSQLLFTTKKFFAYMYIYLFLTMLFLYFLHSSLLQNQNRMMVTSVNSLNHLLQPSKQSAQYVYESFESHMKPHAVVLLFARIAYLEFQKDVPHVEENTKCFTAKV